MGGGKATPGPWLTNCSHIYAPDGAIIAQVHNPGSKASDYPLVANRDLMAAAPRLFDALNGMIGLVQLVCGRPDLPADFPDIMSNHRFIEALGAIAQAEGEFLLAEQEDAK